MPTQIIEKKQGVVFKNSQFNQDMQLYYKKRREKRYRSIPIRFEKEFFVNVSFFEKLLEENGAGILRYDLYVLAEEGHYERLLSDHEESTQYQWIVSDSESHGYIKIYTTYDNYFAMATGFFNEGHVLVQIDDDFSHYIRSFSNGLKSLNLITNNGINIPLDIEKQETGEYKFSLENVLLESNKKKLTGSIVTNDSEEGSPQEIYYGLPPSKLEIILSTNEKVVYTTNEQQTSIKINQELSLGMRDFFICNKKFEIEFPRFNNRKINFFIKSRAKGSEFIDLHFTSESSMNYKLDQNILINQVQFLSLKPSGTYDFYFALDENDTYYRLKVANDSDIGQKEVFFNLNNTFFKYYLTNESGLTLEVENTNDELPKMNMQLVEYSYEKLAFKSAERVKAVDFMIVRRKAREERYIVPGNVEDNQITIFWKEMLNEWSKVQLGGLYDLYLIDRSDDNLQPVYRLANDFGEIKEDQSLNKISVEDTRDRWKKTLELTDRTTSIYSQSIQMYITLDGDWSIHKARSYNLNNTKYKFKAEVFDFFVKSNFYEISIKVNANLESMHLDFKSLVLINRNKLVHSEIIAETTNVLLKDGSVILTSKIFPTEEMKPFYYDLFIKTTDPEINSEPFYLPVKKVKEKVAKYFDQSVFDTFKNVSEYCMYPYITNLGELAFEYRLREKFETEEYWKKEYKIAKFSHVLESKFNNKRIWIVFEKNSQSAHDNAFQFFKYVMEETDMRDIYFVIDPDSSDYCHVLPYKDNVIDFMSDKYFVYLYFASLLISSDTKYHIYNTHVRHSPLGKIIAKKKLVYLQHGINGIKRVPAFHKQSQLLDFIMVPSQYEKQMVINDWGYDSKDVAVTGFARFDNYYDKTDTISYRNIFIMPTWRKWMDGMTQEQFVETSFYEEYNKFLTSRRLRNLMKKNNVRISFFLHPYFKDYIDLFDVDNTFIDKYGYLDVDMSEEVQKSSLLITDYSSIAWDMLYLNRPVIFYQFDQEEYLISEGTYMDYETELFGDIVCSAEGAIKAIEEVITMDYQLSDKYSRLRESYFTYKDRSNRRRIYQTILENEEYFTGGC